MSQHNEEDLSTQTQIGKPRRTNSPRFNPDEDGQPLGKEGDELQSWIGVLARELIPIWISDFRSADLAPRKERVDHIDKETVWQQPPKVVHNYPTISQDDWEKFIVYRRTLEFKRLSEQGSEIRKKSKYRSTGGRDGYRKHDQIHFEKTGKWAERHTRWLDMRVKPDGEFKNETFKIIADTIDDFSEQETQGSFESVRTYDILTKALGNAEHSGRIRGQSKFVKQSQYFSLVQSSRENAEVSDMKRQLAALERTVQELCAKHGINRETMIEETTAPTVDQHNSFKASCTLNEKEAWPSDPQPMPNASKECQLFLPDLVNGGDVLVAIGKAYMDCVPTNTVHGIPLGEENILSGLLCKSKYGSTVRVYFSSPCLTSSTECRSCRLRSREGWKYSTDLRKRTKGKLFLMPYNSGQYWILAVIDSWEDSVMYFNPLENEPGDDFKDLITMKKNKTATQLPDVD
ncbi:hypothetical protein TIFTF001_042977 [Ficus carica]|uniref:Ubiquitin-like protease family profile domain-containing protein n=1 Tax=Ficus carica TaxID=3494 RepID=A0AA88CKJ6_FICCA|nr:hypothetical protein TIFTF001_042977 [Ficus carica]